MSPERRRKAVAIELIDDPKVGDGLFVAGRRLEVVSVAPYQRKTDGKTSVLITWRCLCATCRDPFEFVTGKVGQHVPKRCRSCRDPQAVENGRRGAAIAAQRSTQNRSQQ